MNPPNSPQAPQAQQAADPRQQVLDLIKKSNNVLLTISENPTVDQLAAVIGFTLALNKMGKHATAVFSGKVPSTIEFLQPEKTLEKTTDSLRDFIISLDKSKADKLRYKIEDKYVKIFITPYHTSLSEKDLEFSQGDFNVDVVLALGVKKRDQLDQTIIEHGRILHDATVISVNNTPGADIGSVNWTQTSASGLSEMMVGLTDSLQTEQQKLLDQQIATCFLTGIVAQTERFSNAKTTPQTMSLSAKLMNAGANQQLIATKLQAPAPIPQEPAKVRKPPEPPKPIAPPPPPPKPAPPLPVKQPPATPQVKAVAAKPAEKKPEETETQDGALLVPHEGVTGDSVAYSGTAEENISRIHIDDQGLLKRVVEADDSSSDDSSEDSGDQNRKIVDKPPSMSGPSNSSPSNQSPEANADAMTLPDVKGPTLNHSMPVVPAPSAPSEPPAPPTPPPAGESLSDLEKSVNSPHLRETDAQNIPDSELPTSVVGPDKGLPPDQTAGSTDPSPPPPVPPPIPMAAPPTAPLGPSNMSNPNSGVPL